VQFLYIYIICFLSFEGYQVSITAEKKIMDIKLTTYITMHSSVRSIDHLGELLLTLGKGSILENLQLHRTKCSSIIKHDCTCSFGQFG